MRLVAAGLALAALVAVVTSRPARDAASASVAWVEQVRHLPAAPLLTVAVFVVGGLVVAPLSLLILATVISFGPLAGGAWAMAGSLASAAVTFAVGRLVGRAAVDRVLGRHATRVERWLEGRGVAMVAIVRNVPAAPYSVVNVIAGSCRVRFVDYMVGTFIGLLPGITALAVFGDQVLRFARDPSLATVVGMVVAIGVVSGLSLLVGRRLGRRRNPGRRDGEGASGEDEPHGGTPPRGRRAAMRVVQSLISTGRASSPTTGLPSPSITGRSGELPQ